MAPVLKFKEQPVFQAEPEDNPDQSGAILGYTVMAFGGWLSGLAMGWIIWG